MPNSNIDSQMCRIQLAGQNLVLTCIPDSIQDPLLCPIPRKLYRLDCPFIKIDPHMASMTMKVTHWLQPLSTQTASLNVLGLVHLFTENNKQMGRASTYLMSYPSSSVQQRLTRVLVDGQLLDVSWYRNNFYWNGAHNIVTTDILIVRVILQKMNMKTSHQLMN